MLKKIVILCLFSVQTWAAFGNYNSVLIGEKAAGMGGTGTAILGDPSASSFYNPATLSRMPGRSLSASANLYNKIDTKYGEIDNTIQAAEKINQGSFRSIPSASGSILSYRQFALGLSIIVPDYDYFSGFLKNTSDTKTTLQILDESLWVGGNIAINMDETQSLGLTIYYTSRFYQRTSRDEKLTTVPGAMISSETVSHTHNSVVYILGYYNQLNPVWGFGLSFRPPSIEVSGVGQVFVSTIETPAQVQPISTSRENVKAETRIPMKVGLGVSYTPSKAKTLALDVSFYGEESYADIDSPDVATLIDNRPVLNLSLGYESYINRWLRWRTGIFSNFSSHEDVTIATGRRGDHIDMWGFSTNLAIFTEDQVAFTLGGYYSGGRGHDVQLVGQTFEKIDKSKQIFSFLVGSAYFF